MKPLAVHIDCFEPDYDKFPIPPVDVEPSAKECVHTPMPEGYIEWYEWARRASKTHAPINCPCCGLFKIWKPKKMARAINRRRDEEVRRLVKMMEDAQAST